MLNEPGNDTSDVTKMLYLKHLNAFLCVTIDLEMYIWSFPTNQVQNDLATSIFQREERRRYESSSEDTDDSNSDDSNE